MSQHHQRVRIWRFLCLALLTVFAWGCSKSKAPAEKVGKKAAALNVIEPEEIFGFEDIGLWSSSTAQLSATTDHVQGQQALAVTGVNYNVFTSAPIRYFPLQTNKVIVSVKLPPEQPNPWWFGDVQMFVEAPSVGIYNQYLGYVALTGHPTGQFFDVEFTIPDVVYQALSQPYQDLIVRLVLNVPYDATGTYVFDNIRFGGLSPDAIPPAEVFGRCFPISVDMLEQRVEVRCGQAVQSANNPVNSPFSGALTVTRFALPLSDPMSKRLVKTATIAHTAGMPITFVYQPKGENAIAGCADASCRVPIFFLVSKTTAPCPAFNPFQPNAEFCTPSCPCHVGQVHCDSQADCSGDLVCRPNSGAAYGLPATFATCQPKQCSVGACDGVNNCQCFIGEPCDPTHDPKDCAGLLICDPTSNTCQQCPQFDPSAPHANFCTAQCPCGRAQGDCDPMDADGVILPDGSDDGSPGDPAASNQCRNLARCVVDVGASYGLSAEDDVCLPIYETTLFP